MRSRVRVDVLCVEVSLGGHVVIGVGRVIVQRQLCTCSQTVCCDRQFFPVAIYCTLLHRENGSFEVLCLHDAVSASVIMRNFRIVHA